ncbi:MAG: hypothetical protein H0S80_08185 [Desulfovibrionaceae bacterium]|nr:hypothetical protein [Desulfovibrionaceae bacterium]
MGKKDAKATGGMNLAGGENIDQIRQLLFGPQVKKLEGLIAKLDEKITKDLETFRTAVDSRLETMESYVKNELESLVSALDAERGERADALGRLTTEFRDCCAQQAKKDKELEKAQEKTARDLREFVLEQGKSLGEEIRRKHQQSSDELKRMADTLREEHVDRAVLSSLFTETALKLGDGLMESMLGEAAAPDEE